MLTEKIDHSKEDDPNHRHFSTAHLLHDLRGRTISSGLVTTASQGIQFVLTLGSTMILARLLQPQDFGVVAMVVTVLGFFKIFKDAGLSTATVQRDGITHAQVSNLFWFNIALSGFISLMIAAGAPLIARFYHERRLVPITLVLAIGFILEGSTVQHMALLNRQMRFAMIALIQVSAMAAAVTIGIVMACMKRGYWSLVGFQLTTPLVLCILAWTASRWRPQRFALRSGTRSLLGFGANITLSGFLWTFARNSDSLLIGRIYGADSVGLYSRAVALLNRPLEQFLTPINAVFVPVLSRIQNHPERYRRVFLQAYEAIVLASFLINGLFLVLAKPLTLVVLGQKWEKTAAIFASLTIGAISYSLCSVTSWLYASQGRGGDWLKASFMISSVTICSFIVGLAWGPVGVALAYSCTSILIILPITYRIAGKCGPVTTSDLCTGVLRHLPVWGVVCAATFGMRMLFTTSKPLIQLLACAPVGLLAGGLFIFAYPPSHRVALSLVDILRTVKKARADRASDAG